MAFDIRPLFRGSRFFFWGIVPIGALLLGAMTVATPFGLSKGNLVLYAVDAWFVCLALGLWDPYRFRWALRGFAALFFTACVSYVVDSFRSDGPLFRSLLAMAVFGYPSFTFLVRGSFSWSDSFEHWEELAFKARDESIFRDAFYAAIGSERQLDMQTSLKALASAEILAGLRGVFVQPPAEEREQWNQKNQHLWSHGLALLGQQALARVGTDSEMRDAWEGEGELAAFHQKLKILQEGLQ
jgi:hypothetical protein